MVCVRSCVAVAWVVEEGRGLAVAHVWMTVVRLMFARRGARKVFAMEGGAQSRNGLHRFAMAQLEVECTPSDR